METLTPSVLLDGLVFPEGPRWHDGKLWFSDIHAYKMMAVDPEGRSEMIASVPQHPSGLGFLPDGHLLVAPDGDARVVADGLMYPNGMVITPDGKTLIVAETIGRRLTAFDIAPDGSLSGRRPFADLATGGLGGAPPDGICIDAEGAIWVSSPPTSEFVRVREGGDITHRIPVPGKWAVACMLGGEDRRTLFLCTAETTLKGLGQGESLGWGGQGRGDVPGAGRPSPD